MNRQRLITYIRPSMTTVMTWVAGAAALVIAVVFPAGYFAVSYSSHGTALEMRAAAAASSINSIVSASPEMWQYQELRLREQLDRMMASGETGAIYASGGQLVAQVGEQVVPPALTRSVSLSPSGTNM